MEPVIDHIQITVRDFLVAVAFCGWLMLFFGFNLEKKTGAMISAHDFWVVGYSRFCLAFAVVFSCWSFKGGGVYRRRPNSLHHLAFRVKSREEVNKLNQKVKAIGALIVSSPREYPEYKPAGYYALFFKNLKN